MAHRVHCVAVARLAVWQIGHSMDSGVIAGSGAETRAAAFPTWLLGRPRFYTTETRNHLTILPDESGRQRLTPARAGPVVTAMQLQNQRLLSQGLK